LRSVFITRLKAMRGIVDADVDELPVDATVLALACAVAGGAVPYLVELAEPLMSMWMSSPGRSRW
jgi:hypothetical protein